MEHQKKERESGSVRARTKRIRFNATMVFASYCFGLVLLLGATILGREYFGETLPPLVIVFLGWLAVGGLVLFWQNRQLNLLLARINENQFHMTRFIGGLPCVTITGPEECATCSEEDCPMKSIDSKAP